LPELPAHTDGNTKKLNTILKPKRLNIRGTWIYRILLPKVIRKRIDKQILKSKIFVYYSKLPAPLPEDIEEAINYLKKKPVVMFPNSFQDSYKHEGIEVLFDKAKRLPYVMMGDKRLYFKRRLNKERIRKIFNELLKEQDPKSPHCYENDVFKVEQGDVLVDVGAAEGNFSLSVVERVSRLLIFEGDKEWLEPLEATFEPWKEKVEIVNKFVGDKCNSEYTTLDDYFSPDDQLSFIKIDVEGAEASLLKGSQRILQIKKPAKVAICTYHRAEDESEFNSLLKNYGFKTSHSEGFVLLFRDRQLKAPFLRRGLIRAIKS
jgi:hypothetical protein